MAWRSANRTSFPAASGSAWRWRARWRDGPRFCCAIRPEKIKLSRRGAASDAVNSQAINRLEGVVTDVGYLGGSTVHKVKLDSGAVVRSSMANTARIDRDTYSASERVVAWFTSDDC